ncbi:MAG: hypothetical protein HY738_23155 [Bacteroidia bacterium]|nr:hypothetical protein [Bacteroidia bacterium]
MEIGLSLLGLGIALTAFIFAWAGRKVIISKNKLILEIRQIFRESKERMDPY